MVFDKIKRRKKVKVETGDIIKIISSDNSVTLACVLGFWPTISNVMTIAILSRNITDEILKSDLSQFVSNELKCRELMSIISTTAGTVGVGEWEKVANLENFDLSGLLPDVPYKSNSAEGASYQSAPLVESLIEAYRGLIDWDARLPGRPGFLRSLVYSK